MTRPEPAALVALGIARQDGTLSSPAQENLFLTRWLAHITGSVEGMVALLSTCGWQAVAEGEALPRQYRLTAGQEKGQD